MTGCPTILAKYRANVKDFQYFFSAQYLHARFVVSRYAARGYGVGAAAVALSPYTARV